MKNLLKISIFFSCLCIRLIFLPAVSGKAETAVNYDQQIQTKDHIIQKLLNERRDTQSLIKELKKREWGVLEILKVINDSIKENQEKLEKITKAIDSMRLEILITTGIIGKL
ncbi:hypothetical protein KKA14_14785, partial [bacterium]|nr:hypothetical protein [bacterium]